jgi:hypothetical protein
MKMWSNSHWLNPMGRKSKPRRPKPHPVLRPVGFAAEKCANLHHKPQNSAGPVRLASSALFFYSIDSRFVARRTLGDHIASLILSK